MLFEGYAQMDLFSRISSILTLIIGCIAFSGSVVAAAKLDRRLPQRPIILKGHNFLNVVSLLMLGVLLIIGSLAQTQIALIISLVIFLISLAYGVLFSIRVGGADMPIVISLLITYAGFSNVVLGFAISDVLLVAIGAIVGAAGAILTKLMCEAMNRSLVDILNGSVAKSSEPQKHNEQTFAKTTEEKESPAKLDIYQILKDSKKVIIVPGYGMALAQAQQGVKKLFDVLESQGKEVSFAIHPVAGRMPGHMNVLLAEVDIPYEQLLEMDEINPQFKGTDVAIIIGACDVVNPEAITAKDTPIYGMPILRADEAKNVLVLNLDTKPGYSGVENSLYGRPNVHLLLGNAAETIEDLVVGLRSKLESSQSPDESKGNVECA
jgi:NAD(P) transhydrogenase subunit beta